MIRRLLLPVVLLVALLSTLAACGDPRRSESPEPPLPEAVSPALAALLHEIESLPLEEAAGRTARLVSLEPGTLDALVAVLESLDTDRAQHSRALIAIEGLGPATVPTLLEFFLRSEDEALLQRSFVSLQHVLPGASAWVSHDTHPFTRSWTEADVQALAPYESRLLAVARNGSGRARRYAVLLLMGLPPGARGAASVPLLMDAFEDTDARLVSDAACALMASASVADGAVPRLLELLDGRVEDTRELALVVLERIGRHAPIVAPAFISRAEETEDDEMRCSLLVAVSGMGDHAGGALPILERELRGADLARARAAASCLRALGHKGVAVLANVLRSGDAASQIVAAQMLGRTDKALVTWEVRAALEEASASPVTALATAAQTALDTLDRDA